MAINVIYISNDNILEVNGLKNAQTGAYINSGATVTVTLVDSSGNQVGGETWPVALSYVAASNGIYRANLKDTLVLNNSNNYIAKVSANAGADLQGYWEFPLNAQIRT